MKHGEPPDVQALPPCHCEQAHRHCERAANCRAKQSMENAPRLDCFAASRLAMTTPAPSLRTSPSSLRQAPRHCERSEAIQCEGLLRLDCFTLRVRND
ncbi:MAG: hypothetical protein LBT00_00160 [Spirochaetaceae bacterium]|nr:hypothetical protein [Spirochaetaceae bacterium]